MTVNERLVVSGLIATWDRAIAQGDRAKAIEVLGRVDLESQAGEIVDFALARGSR